MTDKEKITERTLEGWQHRRSYEACMARARNELNKFTKYVFEEQGRDRDLVASYLDSAEEGLECARRFEDYFSVREETEVDSISNNINLCKRLVQDALE